MATWEWLGAPLAIDFANTMLRRANTYVDLLASADDVLAWASHQRGRIEALDRPAVEPRLGELRAARDDVFELLAAAADGRRLPAGARERINARLRGHPVIGLLAAQPGRAVTVVGGKPDGVDALLARVAASAVELVADPSGALGLCDAPSCGQFYIRARANQRWCGPACGNRARVARHTGRASPA